jgi:hypothetical protein
MASERIIFALDPEKDRDILHWLDSQSNKSAAIRHAIRAAMRPATITEDTLRRVLRSELASVMVAGGNGKQGAATGDVDEEAAALLDDMF